MRIVNNQASKKPTPVRRVPLEDISSVSELSSSRFEDQKNSNIAPGSLSVQNRNDRRCVSSVHMKRNRANGKHKEVSKSKNINKLLIFA